MSALFAIFAFVWFVGWAVTLKCASYDIADNPTKIKIQAAVLAFVLWPLLLLGY